MSENLYDEARAFDKAINSLDFDVFFDIAKRLPESPRVDRGCAIALSMMITRKIGSLPCSLQTAIVRATVSILSGWLDEDDEKGGS